MNFIQKAQAVVDATPAPVSFTVMIGSFVLSFLQPIAVCVTIVWGCLQAHGYVKREFGRDFLWLDHLFRKSKGK